MKKAFIKFSVVLCLIYCINLVANQSSNDPETHSTNSSQASKTNLASNLKRETNYTDPDESTFIQGNTSSFQKATSQSTSSSQAPKIVNKQTSTPSTPPVIKYHPINVNTEPLPTIDAYNPGGAYPNRGLYNDSRARLELDKEHTNPGGAYPHRGIKNPIIPSFDEEEEGTEATSSKL